MKISFKEKLNNLIRSRFPDSVSINEIEQFCKDEHKKLSNAERRLRNSESPDVLKIYNNAPGKNRAIVGYVWNKDGQVDISDTNYEIEQVKQAFKDFEIKSSQQKLI